jgi:hypothetical protein
MSILGNFHGKALKMNVFGKHVNGIDNFLDKAIWKIKEFNKNNRR